MIRGLTKKSDRDFVYVCMNAWERDMYTVPKSGEKNSLIPFFLAGCCSAVRGCKTSSLEKKLCSDIRCDINGMLRRACEQTSKWIYVSASSELVFCRLYRNVRVYGQFVVKISRNLLINQKKNRIRRKINSIIIYVPVLVVAFVYVSIKEWIGG